ncbi:MAG: RedB protein [Candidatus Melainabacteria bacterium]|nr:RedB protein [Candidatus Melainabacteria bacterium]
MTSDLIDSGASKEPQQRIQGEKRETLSLSKLLMMTAFSAFWLGAIIFGYLHLVSYESKPGEKSAHPQEFPMESALAISKSTDTLFMFIHPRCPCTGASLTELALLSTRCAGKLDITTVFLRPPGTEAGWEQTGHWKRAKAIPGVKVVSDDSGKEAQLFGARTSGEVLLYNPAGKLIFNGGITGARGHEGDNQGLDSVLGIVKAKDMRCQITNVFGCALNSPPEDVAIAQGLKK